MLHQSRVLELAQRWLREQITPPPCHPIAAGNRSHPKPAGTPRRVVCGAKRLRSLYLPLVRDRLSRLSPTSPPKGPASVSTINAATMRLCRADLPAANHPVAARSRSHRAPADRAEGPERRRAISAVVTRRSCKIRGRGRRTPGAPVPSEVRDCHFKNSC